MSTGRRAGTDLISAVPRDGYERISGTSMAGPVVATDPPPGDGGGETATEDQTGGEVTDLVSPSDVE